MDNLFNSLLEDQIKKSVDSTVQWMTDRDITFNVTMATMLPELIRLENKTGLTRFAQSLKAVDGPSSEQAKSRLDALLTEHQERAQIVRDLAAKGGVVGQEYIKAHGQQTPEAMDYAKKVDALRGQVKANKGSDKKPSEKELTNSDQKYLDRLRVAAGDVVISPRGLNNSLKLLGKETVYANVSVRQERIGILSDYIEQVRLMQTRDASVSSPRTQQALSAVKCITSQLLEAEKMVQQNPGNTSPKLERFISDCYKQATDITQSPTQRIMKLQSIIKPTTTQDYKQSMSALRKENAEPKVEASVSKTMK